MNPVKQPKTENQDWSYLTISRGHDTKEWTNIIIQIDSWTDRNSKRKASTSTYARRFQSEG